MHQFGFIYKIIQKSRLINILRINCAPSWFYLQDYKEIKIDKYTKNKLCTKLVLFTRLYRNARSTKHKICLAIFFAVNVNDLWVCLALIFNTKVASWWNAEAKSDEDGYTIRSCELCFKKNEMVLGIVCFMICKRKALGIWPTYRVYVQLV